jgi:hypothetical protein
MRFWTSVVTTIVSIVTAFALLGTMRAQTITTGQLGGTVTDPSGAIVAGASARLKSLEDGSTTNIKTNEQGYYQFSLLKPGRYSVTVIAGGFQSASKQVTVALGSALTANFRLALGTSTTAIDVMGAVAAVEVEDANLNTNFNAQQVSLLPNPGNDLSAVVMTSPGVVPNTSGGSQFGGGNYEMFGMPATSNLFTIDGANANDPYFNVNNSGATNLTLGLNDVQESAVVVNGYSGSYGGLAGANINFVSKSGSNRFHGNALWWWNGDILNANDWYRNQANALTGRDVDPRLFVNANQYATSFGGPIKKDKAFFFFDYEGIRLAIPSPATVFVPTPAFATAVEGNVPPSQLPFYQQMFKNWATVSHAGAIQLGNGGCNGVTTIGTQTFGATNPCTVQLQAGLSNHAHDYLWVGRFDQNIGNSDKLFVRVQHEHGFQPSLTDPFNPAFNLVSDQPYWQSQVSETHTFGADKVNSFLASMNWYAITFEAPSEGANIAALPATVGFNDGSLSTLNSQGDNQPQGRNITQYQFVDDFSWVRGRHNLKAGINFRRDDVSDLTLGQLTLPTINFTSLADFVNGTGAAAPGQVADLGLQSFPSQREVRLGFYQLGTYVADDLRVTNNLKVTLSLRLDHLSDPVCQTHCFQRLVGPFQEIGHAGALNAAILGGQRTAFPSVMALAAQPKIGFAWSPFGWKDTVLRGGIGIFADSLPTGALDSFLEAAPLDPIFQVANGLPAPGSGPTDLTTQLAAANRSFKANYAAGNPIGFPVNFTNATKVVVPRYYEWSLELQQAIGWKTTLDTMYVGNHGSHEELANPALNAFSATPFADLPTAKPDARFGEVVQIGNVANSNYDGLVIRARHIVTGGFEFAASYTFGHALDEISNNSTSPFGLTFTQSPDVVFPVDPYNIRKYNYGNATYDVRHNFSMNYVWSDGLRHLTQWGPNALMKGWTFSGTAFRHSGLPFTPYSGVVSANLAGNNYGSGLQDYVLADQVSASATNCSGRAAQIGHPCLSANSFIDPAMTFGNIRRNSFRGPGYFDTDFSVGKAFGIPRWESAQFSVGARFFNFFNHPNFAYPIANIDNPAFGTIPGPTVSAPTTIYGSGLGADASPRVIQLQAEFQF